MEMGLSRNVRINRSIRILTRILCVMALLGMGTSCASPIKSTTLPDGTISRTVDEEALSYQITAGQWILSGCDGVCAVLNASGQMPQSSYAAYQTISATAYVTLEAARCALQNYQVLKNGANEQAMSVAFNDLCRIVLRLSSIYQGMDPAKVSNHGGSS